MKRYFIIYKPFNVLSQFTSGDGKKTLAFYGLPKDVYPVGRLDYDSEGLLILTNDAQLNHRLLHPAFNHEREYWVQVEGAITPNAIDMMEHGLTINLNGQSYRTKPCKAFIFSTPPPVPDRDPPIRYRKNIPDSWINLKLTEGKNRQVRKMTAKTGFPTLRLIRHSIVRLTLQDMQPGDMKEMTSAEIHDALFNRK